MRGQGLWVSCKVDPAVTRIASGRSLYDLVRGGPTEYYPRPWQVLFVFGEIDCREGLLVAVEKGASLRTKCIVIRRRLLIGGAVLQAAMWTSQRL